MGEFDLKENLSALIEKSREKDLLSIGEILKILSGKGRVVVLILLSLPFCQPLSIPGLSTVFGLVIACIGLSLALRKHMWLPKSVLRKTVSSAEIRKIAKKCLKFMKKINRFIHPRLKWLCEQRFMHVCNGLLIVLLGILLALPLPIPLTNLAVGWALLLISIGLLENDGLFLLMGYFVAMLTIAFFISLPFSVKFFF